MKPEKQLIIAESESALAVTASEPSTGQMLQLFIEKGITPDNVTAFEKLIALRERQEDREAERQFAAAFIALQSEIPEIHATTGVPDKQGNMKFFFAPYEQIMDAVRPLLLKHGFSVTFNCDIKDDRVTQICTLMHRGGHSRANNFSARIGSGPPGASGAQADGAAATYAKRFALCSALNITIERDNDARSEGGSINPDQVQYLRERVREVGFNEGNFFRLAGCGNYEEISEGKYPVLINALAMKEARK